MKIEKCYLLPGFATVQAPMARGPVHAAAAKDHRKPTSLEGKPHG